jgi:hypothetical protein
MASLFVIKYLKLIIRHNNYSLPFLQEMMMAVMMSVIGVHIKISFLVQL